MSDELPVNLRPVVDFFGLVGTAAVVKDFYVVRAIRVIASLDTAPFDLVFGGGTALARAHRLVRRMSEDVDFKIVPRAAAPVSRSGLKRALSTLRNRVTAALQDAGFAFDPKDERFTKSRNKDHYTVWHLPYDSGGEAGQGLRPEIQIELTYAPIRLPAVTLPVSSFVTEALGQAPDIAGIPCVSLNETAAEKLIGLTRRTAMEMAGLSRKPFDPTIVRHIYDLHMMGTHIDTMAVGRLASEIAETDAIEFQSQFPAYAADTIGETRNAIHELRTEPSYRRHFEDFMAAMVYGEKPEYVDGLARVEELAKILEFAIAGRR